MLKYRAEQLVHVSIKLVDATPTGLVPAGQVMFWQLDYRTRRRATAATAYSQQPHVGKQSANMTLLLKKTFVRLAITLAARIVRTCAGTLNFPHSHAVHTGQSWSFALEERYLPARQASQPLDLSVKPIPFGTYPSGQKYWRHGPEDAFA